MKKEKKHEEKIDLPKEEIKQVERLINGHRRFLEAVGRM